MINQSRTGQIHIYIVLVEFLEFVRPDLYISVLNGWQEKPKPDNDNIQIGALHNKKCTKAVFMKFCK